MMLAGCLLLLWRDRTFEATLPLERTRLLCLWETRWLVSEFVHVLFHEMHMIMYNYMSCFWPRKYSSYSICNYWITYFQAVSFDDNV